MRVELLRIRQRCGFMPDLRRLQRSWCRWRYLRQLQHQRCRARRRLIVPCWPPAAQLRFGRLDRIRDLALLAMAHGALRIFRPLRAHAVMMRVGAWLPRLETAEEARRVARSLRRHGSCLSRALVVASRAPTADVVIGVEPRSNEQLVAHAWIEMDGSPIHPSEVTGKTIVRLRGTRPG